MQCSLTLITQTKPIDASSHSLSSQIWLGSLLAFDLPSVATHDCCVPSFFLDIPSFYLNITVFCVDLPYWDCVGIDLPFWYWIGKVFGCEVRLVIVVSLHLDEATFQSGLHPAQTTSCILVPTCPIQFVPVLVVHPEFIAFEYKDGFSGTGWQKESL